MRVYAPSEPRRIKAASDLLHVTRPRASVSTSAGSRLTVGPSGDRYEQEADRIAEQVMRPSGPVDASSELSPVHAMAAETHVQRMCAVCEQEDEQIRGKPNGSSLALPTAVTSRIDATRGGGTPLPASALTFFEQRLGHDFSGVRVHADASAQMLAEELNAQAFTVGRDVYFNAGQYAPSTDVGRRLLAHELTHVVQQRGGHERVQRKEKVPWKYTYKTEEEAGRHVKELRDKGLTVFKPTKRGKEWGFDVEVLSKAEAEAMAKKAADPKYDVTVEKDSISQSWYVRKVLKCPEGLPAKADYKTWDSCFAKESDAHALEQKFAKAHIKATVSPEQPSGKYGVYYAPLTKTGAEAAAKQDIAARVDKDSPMYTPSVTEKKDLKSFTYDIDVSCPKGYTDLGTFKLTAYPLANEKDFPDKPAVKDPCGLKGTFSEAFLSQTSKAPRGVKMQGSGVAKDGSFIHYEGNDCFKKVSKVVGAANKELEPMKSVAVDKSVISLGSELLVESFGEARADDTGGKVRGKHLDLYYGLTVSGLAANKLTRDGKVCKKNKK
ncbi:MAG TPA: DUF4157 domain-containing protein [Kofleriaceae bacterium]|nr:DUF4157 domain-containing protein [Kofleriaceae bacterium]